LVRLQLRINRLTAKAHQNLEADPGKAITALIALCRTYRSLAQLAVLNMAGSLFIAESCAAHMGKRRLSRRLDRLGMKYLNLAVPGNVPEPLVQFLGALDAMSLLSTRDSRLAKEMKRLAAEAAAGGRKRDASVEA